MITIAILSLERSKFLLKRKELKMTRLVLKRRKSAGDVFMTVLNMICGKKRMTN